MVSVRPPRSGTGPIMTLFRLVRVFSLAWLLDTFSTTAASSLAARRLCSPTPELASMLERLLLYSSPITPSFPAILSDQVKLCMVASSLVRSICRRRL